MHRVLIAILSLVTVLLWSVVSLAGIRAVPFEGEQDFNFKLVPAHVTLTAGKPALETNLNKAAYFNALLSGAERLADFQSANDGGWGWGGDSSPASHSGTASPVNTYGVTAMGVLGAYIRHGLASQQTVIQNAFTGIEANTLIRTGGVPQFLIRAKQELGVQAYADTAKSRYDVRKALSPPNGTAGDRARQIRAARCGGGLCNGIIPWDIGLVAVDAFEVANEFGGTYGDDVDSMAKVIYDVMFAGDTTYFNWTNRDEWWWTLGLAGALDGLVASGDYSTEVETLLDTLLKYQLPDNSWEWHGGIYGGIGDWQTTAYVVKALMSYADIVGGPRKLEACQAAAQGAWWLVGEQQAYNKGWYYHDVSVGVDGYCENTEVEGEILWALHLGIECGYTSTPSFTSFGYFALPALMVVLAVVFFVRRKKAIA